jgi:hypothetical protein
MSLSTPQTSADPLSIALQVLAALADNAKHNQHGRVDEHGALRHRIPQLCGVGALAMHFFAHFHILSNPVPDFAPDFDSPNGGVYGLRPWYTYHVFYPHSHKGTVTRAMTYDSEHPALLKRPQC